MLSDILVLSHSDEPHSNYIKQVLQNRGESVFFLDGRDFPNQIQVEYSPTIGGQPKLWIQNQLVYPKSIYWRWYHSPQIQKTCTEEMLQTAFRNTESAYKGLLGQIECLWVNPPESYYLHWSKPMQLALFRSNGIALPETYITNNFEFAMERYADSQKQWIFKPVQGGFHTQVLNEQSLPKFRETLACMPVTLQRYIKGDDIRVYIVGTKLYSMKIISNTTDFREDLAHQVVPVDIPEAVKKMCLLVSRVSKYIFTAIDIKKDQEGNYFFLEANPSPMFYKIEQDTGFPITQSLCDLLIHGK